MYHWLEIKNRIYYVLFSFFCLFLIGWFYKKKLLIFVITPLIKSNCANLVQFTTPTDLVYGWFLVNITYSIFFSVFFISKQITYFISRGKTQYEFLKYKLFTKIIFVLPFLFLVLHTQIAKKIIYYFFDFTTLIEEKKNLFVFFPNFFSWILLENTIILYSTIIFVFLHGYLLFMDRKKISFVNMTYKYKNKLILNFSILVLIIMILPCDVLSFLILVCINYVIIEIFFLYKCITYNNKYYSNSLPLFF